MAEKNFDPKKFIDREFEQELFEELLQLKDNARILAIQDDKGGMGKSQLLEQFKYRCRTVKPRTPVSLIALDQLPGDSPLDLIIWWYSIFPISRSTFQNLTGTKAREFPKISPRSGRRSICREQAFGKPKTS